MSYFEEETFQEQFTVEVSVDKKSGRIVGEKWFNSAGRLDRLGDMPAEIVYCPETGKATTQVWYKDGQVHRENDQPAIIVHPAECELPTLQWYQLNGQDHRDGDRPSKIARHFNGAIEEEQYSKHGKPHRIDKPYLLQYDEDGRLIFQGFAVEGRVLDFDAFDPPADPSAEPS